MCQTTITSRETCTIVSNEAIASNVFEMIIHWPKGAAKAAPGQFANLYCHHQGRLLPRPISICEIDVPKGNMHFVYAILAAGTKEFTSFKAGELIEVMGPFGHGFSLDEADHHLLIGGGVGTPPMVELAKQLKGEKTIVVGFRTEGYLIDRLEKYGKVYVATDDGSVGTHGTVMDVIREKKLSGKIQACGPTPMLKAIQAFGIEADLPMELSLEERMGCGFGGCVGCVTRIKADTKEGFVYKKVCKDGPVFEGKEVLFQ